MRSLLALFVACALTACTPPTMASLPWNDQCDTAEAPQQSIDACTRIIDAANANNDTKSRAHSSRAFAYDRLERPELAAADYAAAIRLTPEDPYAYIARANSHERARRYAEALPDIAEAVRLDPENTSFLNDACWVRAVLNRELDEAAGFCERAIAVVRDDPNVWDSFALVRFRQGRFTEAYHHYDIAVRADEEHAHYRYGRGLAALRIGKEAEGRADIAAALALDAKIGDSYAEYGITP